MKPRNSPGRVNQRRIVAQGRLSPGTDEYVTLAKRIMSQEQADAIRSKKTEALGWSEGRKAWRRGRIAR